MSKINLLDGFYQIFKRDLKEEVPEGGEEELIFEVVNFYEEVIAEQSIKITASPEEVLNSERIVKEAKIEIDAYPDLRFAISGRQIKLGSLFPIDYYNGSKFDVAITAYGEPYGKPLVNALDAMARGHSMALNKLVIVEQLGFIKDYFLRDVIAAVFALIRLLDDGAIDEESIRCFYELAVDERVDKVRPSSTLIFFYGAEDLIASEYMAWTESYTLAKAYLGAAAIYELSKEFPVIRHLELFEDLLDIVEACLEDRD